MKNAEELKEVVRQKYGEITLQSKEQNESSCCGATCCSDEVYSIMSDDYSQLAGYTKEADLGLGCGLPTQFAKIKKGDTVVDLGSGAGNDCFVARNETGAEGLVIGIDMTQPMIDKAKINAEKLGFTNVDFILGEIEQLPLENSSSDVVVSNCVLNLVPDKKKAFTEIYRILKPGGHFSISDIVLEGTLPAKIISVAEFYSGCVSGAIKKESYLGMIERSGFKNIQVQKQKKIMFPDDILLKYLDESDLAELKNSGAGIFSITVYAEKPIDGCCDKTTCCN